MLMVRQASLSVALVCCWMIDMAPVGPRAVRLRRWGRKGCLSFGERWGFGLVGAVCVCMCLSWLAGSVLAVGCCLLRQACNTSTDDGGGGARMGLSFNWEEVVWGGEAMPPDLPYTCVS